MGVIHIPRRRFTQPQGRLTVHPQWADRLRSLIHFGEAGARDLVDAGARYSRGGGAVIEPAAHGLGLRTPLSFSYIESSGALANWTGNPTLIFFLPEIASTQGGSGAMFYAITAATSYTQTTPAGTGLHILGSGGSYALGENIHGTRNRSLIIRAAGADPAIFIDRRKVSGGTGTIGSGAKTIRLGAWSADGWQFAGVMGSAAVIAGPISDAEAREWVDNPWIAYAEDPVRIYSLPAATTPSSLSVAASNVTSSGARATVTLAF